MKKTITKSDGSTETIEGTADEIAEYERKLKKGSLKEVPKPKKEILKGKSLPELMREFMEKYPQPLQYNPIPYPYYHPQLEHSPMCELKVAERGWMSVIPPRCSCGLIAYPNIGTIIYGTTTTGDTTKLDGNGGSWTSGYITHQQ